MHWPFSLIKRGMAGMSRTPKRWRTPTSNTTPATMPLDRGCSMAKTITYLCSEAQAEHERVYGGFNDFPPNWKRCTPNEFWGKFNCYGIGEKVEYRQMHTEGAIVMAHLFFYHDDTGLGLVHCYENGKHRPPLLYN